MQAAAKSPVILVLVNGGAIAMRELKESAKARHAKAAHTYQHYHILSLLEFGGQQQDLVFVVPGSPRHDLGYNIPDLGGLWGTYLSTRLYESRYPEVPGVLRIARGYILTEAMICALNNCLFPARRWERSWSPSTLDSLPRRRPCACCSVRCASWPVERALLTPQADPGVTLSPR